MPVDGPMPLRLIYSWCEASSRMDTAAFLE